MSRWILCELSLEHSPRRRFAREPDSATYRQASSDEPLAPAHGTDSGQLIALRVHHVTVEMVRAVHDAGYQPNGEQLVAMRIHGVTPEYIGQLQARGVKGLTLEKLVTMKIHGID